MDSIPCAQVPHSTPLLVDYLDRYERLADYYSGSPFDSEAYRRVADTIKISDRHRRSLTEVLERQNRAFGCGDETLSRIDRLSRPGTLAVATGQQVGLLGGPAFTLYKALSAIRLADSLTRQGLSSVPIFWLANEDHDFEEVAQTAVPGGDYEEVLLRDDGERTAAQAPVGLTNYSAEISATLDRLEALLPAGENRDRLLADLRECYRPGVAWGEAFGRWMTKLFSRWGVVMLDPLDAEIHRMSVPLYARALEDADRLRSALLARSEALVRAGYHAQVRVQENSTLLFLARNGSRTALHRGRAKGEFIVDDSEVLSGRELKRRLEERPLDFSANALLRPIVQDSLLPTVAYVGGAGELAYLGQAQSIYEISGRAMPVVSVRASFTLLDARIHRVMDRYRMSVEDVWQGKDHLTNKIAAGGFAEGWSEHFDQSEQELRKLLERLRGDIEKLDPTLHDALKHAEEKMKFQMERLRGKVARAAMARSELLSRHEDSLLRFVMPGKTLQERKISGAYFLGCAGYGLLERLLELIPAESSEHRIVTY